MTIRTSIENEAIARLMRTAFDEGFTPHKVSQAEKKLLVKIGHYVETRFNTVTYILGLALDFTIVAQKISQFDAAAKSFRENLDEATLFALYPRTTSTTEKNVNTLTFTVQDNRKTKKIGIRVVEEDVCDFFLAADRTGYPSAYVYNTGMWQHYREMLVDCFKLSESGRYLLCQWLIDFGLRRLPKNTFYGREKERPRLFDQIIRDYPHGSQESETAGMVMQGIAYGYLKADRPHLSLIVDKSRTGSARQRRFGDIDGYYGLDLELSAEVKNQDITLATVESEFGRFAKDVHLHHTLGLAFVLSMESEARAWLANYGIVTQDIPTLLRLVEAWDWQKQDIAVHGLLHFLAHIDQKPEAVIRLLKFIHGRDPSHPSLTYLQIEGETR